MSGATYVVKRFLAGVNGDYINADHIVRIYVKDGKLMADMTYGPVIQLKTNMTAWAPGTSPMMLTEMVSL